MKIKISADSTCDLSRELQERYQVGIIPLYVVRDGEALKDGIEIFPQDIYDHEAATGQLCTTAAVSVADYIEYFTERRKDCDALIHFHIASGMSACYQNACIAAEEVEGVYPVDSGNLSTGIGLLVIAAAEMASQGMDVQTIVEKLKELTGKVESSFLVDTLHYLRKGGRCSAVAALGANLLSLKPCIEVRDGAMGVGKKYRGSMKKCLSQYVQERLEGRTDIDTRRVIITDSNGFTDEEREAVREELLRFQNFEEVFFTRAGGTISSHCGPGTLGIMFMTK